MLCNDRFVGGGGCGDVPLITAASPKIYITPSVIAHSINCVIYGDWKFAMLCKMYFAIIFRADLWKEGDTVI